MKLAIVRQRYNPYGGAERIISRVLPFVEKQGAEVTLITRRGDGWGARRVLRVDPFYLAEFAQRMGHHPEIILAGRRINDGMGDHMAGRIAAALAESGGARPAGRVLVLGLTFKENVPDLRNSKVIDLIDGLQRRGHAVDVHDPHADPSEAKSSYGIGLLPSLDGVSPYRALVGAVGGAGFLVTLYAIAVRWGTNIPLEWVAFSLLTFASGMFTLKIPSIDALLSVSEIFAFSCVLLFGPELGALTVTIDALLLSLRRKHGLTFTVFNVGNLTLSVWSSERT